MRKLTEPMAFGGFARNCVLQIVDELSTGDGKSMGMEPMRIHHPKFSRFKLSIITNAKKSATDFIAVGNQGGKFEQMLYYSKYANEAHFRWLLSHGSGGNEKNHDLAYSVLNVGRSKGKTAAEFVASSSPEAVNAQLDFLKANADKFAKNREDIVAIERAVRLYSCGKLDVKASSSAPSVVIYDSGQRNNIHATNPDGSHPSNHTEITWQLGAEYPVTVKITKGKVFTAEGSITGTMVEPKTTSISIQACEWMRCVNYMERQEMAFWQMHWIDARNVSVRMKKFMDQARQAAQQNGHAAPQQNTRRNGRAVSQQGTQQNGYAVPQQTGIPQNVQAYRPPVQNCRPQQTVQSY